MEEKILLDFYKKQDEIITDIWNCIVAKGFDTDCLCDFRSQVGRLYKSEGDSISILTSGKATNGWDGSYASDRPHLFPVHASAFLAVNRMIAAHFFPGPFPEDHLVWTNAAHVSDVDSGNPTRKLWNAQYQGICAISTLEQTLLKPLVSLYMTGSRTDWDSPLWAYLNSHACSDILFESSITNRGGRVCHMLAYECDRRLYVITDRPEGFCYRSFADAVISMIQRWMNRRK